MNYIYIDIHTHKSKNKFAIQNLFHNEHIPCNNRLFSKALHPWHIDESNFNLQLSELEQELNLDNIIAIGECGLDKLKGVDLKIQEKVFEWHINQSEKLKKPLIIHCVRCFNEIIELKLKFSPNSTWIIHGFNSKVGILQQLLKHNFHISLGINILANPKKLKQYLEIIPLDKLFFETDESDIKIEEIYITASKGLNIEVPDLVAIIEANFRKIFDISD
ncbi:MAG: hydrolase TatD [Bacteroidales bacterium]|nr:hydrolase TatD [Bacteroidales bacterium]